MFLLSYAYSYELMPAYIALRQDFFTDDIKHYRATKVYSDITETDHPLEVGLR